MRRRIILPTIEDFPFRETPSQLGLPHRVWRKSQYNAYRSVLNLHENGGGVAIIELPTGCISGNSMIPVNRAGKRRKFNIKDAYLKSKSTWIKDVKSNIRSYDEDKNLVILNEALEFVFSGQKATYTLTLDNGMSLRATANHKIMTKDGYVSLINCTEETMILCDTSTPGLKNKKTRYKLVSSLVYHPYCDNIINNHFKNRISNRVPYHRLIAESLINNISVDLLIDKCKSGDINGLVFLDTAIFAVHHIDGNSKNNDPKNLSVLTHAEHLALHGKQNTKNFGYPSYSKVKSILYYGIEDTYDIICKEPYHNFVANGIIIHNSGKTGVATALSNTVPITALVQNLGLLEQYGRVYGFDIIKGKQEYDCVLKPKVNAWVSMTGKIPTVSDCHFDNLRHCPVSSQCPYLIARAKALASNRMACTYKYASLSEAVSKREGILVMDEGHLSPDEILSVSKFTMDDNTRRRFNFDEFPLPMFGINSEGDILSETNKKIVFDWLVRCANTVSDIDLFDTMTPKAAAHKRITEELQSGINILNSSADLFYTCRFRDMSNWDVTKSGLEMCIRPIDPKQVVALLMKNKHTTMLMSATIGNPAPLAEELGIEHYHFFNYPHPVPTEARPIYDLHVGKMTRVELDKNPELYRVQANAIVSFINKQNPDWRVLIVTSSYDKVKRLRQFIGERLSERMFQQTRAKVSDRIQNFINDTTPGMILVDTIQGFGTGVDLHDDIARIAIMAGIPYPNPSDRYEVARMSREGGSRYAFWKSYSAVPQATGRVSRGEKEKDGSWLLNVGAIADGSATTPTAYSYYSNWYKDSIIR